VRLFERGSERVEIDVVDHTIVIRRHRNGTVETSSQEASSAPTAKWDADRMAAAFVEQGFVRVGGDAVAPSQDELIARLEANPEELDTYDVLADWLSDRGDPWGLVIAVQTAIARIPRFTPEPRRDELARADALQLFQHASRLWGELGDTIVDANTQTYAIDRLHPEWYCGFVRAIRADLDGVEHLRALAGLEIARLLQVIEIGSDAWPIGVLDPLIDASWPQLHTLTLHSRSADPMYAWRRRRGVAMPPDELELDAGALAPILDGKRAPRLRNLAISHSRGTDALCRALAASPLAPKLRSLALHYSELTGDGIAALERARFDALDELMISGFGPEDAAARLAKKARAVRVNVRPQILDDDDD
jgi:hypothetical protein